MSSILDGLDAFPPAWRHEPGDKIAGTVLSDPDEGMSEHGPYPLFPLEVTAGTELGGQPIPAGEERTVHAFRTVLKNEVEKKQPREGDEVGIAALGYPEGKDWYGYRLRIRRNGQTVSSSPSEPPDTPAPNRQLEEDDEPLEF